MQEPSDANETVSQLHAELGRLRARVAELEAGQARGQQVEEALRRQAQELDALQATVLDITIPHELPTLLETIVERAARLLDAPSGGLYRCDAERQQVHCVVSYSTPGDYRGTTLEYGEGAAGTVAQTAAPLVIDDYGTWEGRAPAFEQERPFRAVLAVPMIWQGAVTGVIDIVRYEEGACFTEEDLALLTLFANHAAIAVENTRLYEQAQEEIAKRRRLEQQSEERRVYLENVLACTPDAIVTLDAQHHVLEWNPGAEKLFGYTLEEAVGHDLDALIAAPDAAMYEQATGFTRQALYGDPVPPTGTVRYRKDGSPIDVIVAGSPIFVQDELVGTVAVYTDITGYKKAQRALHGRVEELDALQATVLDITIPHDLPTVLEIIVERAARLLNAPGGGLYLCEPNQEQVRCVVSLNAPRDFRGTVFKYGEGIVGTVAKTGKPIKIDGRWAVKEHAPDPDEAPPFGAVVAVPLTWQGAVTGVIVIVHTLEGLAFSNADLELLTLFANHAAIAVENARLHDLAQEEIAERKWIAKELNSSRQLLQTIYDAIPDAVISTDPSFRIVSCNAAVERILGYRTDELMGQNYTAILPREMSLDPRQGSRQAGLFEKGYLAEEEDYYFKRKDGRTFPASFSVALIKDEQGRPMGAVGTIRDITERRQAEEEIRRLKEFNEGIVQHMAEGIAVQDSKGYFTFVNPAGTQMLGYAPEELIGKHWMSVVPPEQQPIVQAADERRMRGEADRYEVELLSRDGIRLPVLVSGSPRFEAETGQFAGTLAVFTDISERVLAEQALARRAREMAALYKTSLEINAQQVLSTLLNAIVQRAVELVGARMGGLYLIKPGGQELELVVGYNLPAEYIGVTLELGEGLSGRIAQGGEPMMVADYQAWEGHADVFRDYPFRRVLGIPLQIGDRVIGVINVTDDDQTGPFDEDQVRLVSLFADQAAIAIENTRLFQETQQRLKELTLLFETSTAISTSLNEDRVLRTAAEQITSVLEVEGCSITLWDRDQDALISRLDYSPNPKECTPAAPATVYHLADFPATRELLLNHQPLIVHVSDPHADPADIVWMRHEGVLSLLMVPMIVRDEAIGILEIHEIHSEREFSPTEISVCQTLANQAAAALENARLFQETEQRLKELTLLFETSTAISTSLDVDEVLRVTAQQITTALAAEGCAISLWDRDQDVLVGKLDYSSGPAGWEPDPPGTVYHLDDYPATRQVLECRQPQSVQVSDPEADPAEVALMKQVNIQSLLMVPLVVRDQVIGLLEIEEAHKERVFSPTEISLCQTLATLAAAALENARLFEETSRRAEQMATLNRIGLAITSALDPGEVLDILYEQVKRVMDVDAFYVALYDDETGLIHFPLVTGGIGAAQVEPVDLHCQRGVTGHVIRSGKPLHIPDMLELPDTAPYRPIALTDPPTRCYVGVPLAFRDRVRGVLSVQSSKPNAYTAADIELLTTIGTQATTAIENARLFEAEREQRELAEALRRAAAAVSSTLDLDQVLDLILEQVNRVITCDAANVMLIEGDQARIVRSRGYERFGVSDSIQSITFHIRDTPGLLQVLETGEPLVIPDTAAFPGWIDVPETRWLGSIAMSPICVQDRVIGFLNVDSATSEFFSTGHIDRLRAFADQASLALTNAQLFQTVEQGKRDWETTFDAMQDAVALVDRADRVVRANRAFADLLDRDPQELTGRAYHGLLDGSVCPESACPLERTRQSGQPAMCVHEYQGQILEVQTTPILTDGTKEPDFASRVIYILRDITERREAEREIHRRNRDLALLNRVIAASATNQEIEPALETACRDLALALDVPHSIAILYSQEQRESVIAAEHRSGDRAPVLGRSIPLVGTPIHQYLQQMQSPLVVDDARIHPRTAHLRDLMLEQGIASLLILPLSVEGEVVGGIVLLSAEPRSFSDDKVNLAWRVAEQVSGALARARLQESQRRLSAAVEQAAEAVVITDTDGIILYANPAFEQLTGFDSTEFIGRSPRLFAEVNQDRTVHADMWQVVSGGQPWQGRFTGHSKDGRPFKVDMLITPVRNQTGEVVNLVGTMRDVTREVQLEEQFQQAQRMEALGRLAGGIAHDFNNLLTVIHLSTRLMERQMRPEDPLLDHIQRIRETGERATKLTKQLLSFSRREFAEPQVLDLNQVVGDLSRMLKRIIGEDIDLVTDLADDLWLIEIDPSQMDQVLMNLVLNARDAMPDGGTLTIRTANTVLDEAYAAAHVDARLGRHVLLTISDTGMGIDDEAKAHLFEPFFTTKQMGQGTGLGLSTVFGIVTQNGGHIRVESEPGQGATFQILLPSTTDRRVRVVPSAQPPLPLQPTTGTETILVAEDEEDVRNLAVSVLRSCGYHVLVAKDGPEAIQISEHHRQPIHLLIADVVMPQLGGRELAERLQRQRPEMRVMYMSGYVDQEIAQYSASTPGTIFMSKPFTIEELTHKVRSVLDERL
jgi:PAS domain S-box-containing protein